MSIIERQAVVLRKFKKDAGFKSAKSIANLLGISEVSYYQRLNSVVMRIDELETLCRYAKDNCIPQPDLNFLIGADEVELNLHPEPEKVS